MLVVYGVELILFHQPLEMRKFHGDDTARFQQNLHAGNKVVYIRHLSENVIAQKEIRLFSGIGEFAGGFTPEEFYEGRHTSLDGDGRDVRGRLDAEDRHFIPYKVLKQIAIVTRQFHDKVAGVNTKSLDH